jgi:hypothetical protein
MKKIAVIIMLLAMVLSLLGGCFKLPKNTSSKPSELQSDNEDKDSPDVEETEDADVTDLAEVEDTDPNAGVVESLAPATNPSEGYSNYITYKSAAYDRVVAASESSDSLSMTVAMGYLGVAMVDLSLISLTMFTEDLQSSEMAMAILGMADAKITNNGNDYTITYTDAEGASIKQTCSYDPVKDQMESVLYDADGNITMFFEYVFLGGAYAAQYYFTSGDGYEVIRSYFDKDNIAAFGTMTATDEPASILGQSNFGADFVENEQSYVILDGTKLTAFDNGTITTN